MRSVVPLLLCGLVLAGTIVSVSATVDDAADGGITSITVSRKADPPSYTITLCETPPCPITGTYTVTLGSNTVTIRKGTGGWEWQCEDEHGGLIGSPGWHPIGGGGADDGNGHCCISFTAPDADVGSPAQAEQNKPVQGQTTYTLSFGASDGTDSTAT